MNQKHFDMALVVQGAKLVEELISNWGTSNPHDKAESNASQIEAISLHELSTNSISETGIANGLELQLKTKEEQSYTVPVQIKRRALAWHKLPEGVRSNLTEKGLTTTDLRTSIDDKAAEKWQVEGYFLTYASALDQEANEQKRAAFIREHLNPDDESKQSACLFYEVTTPHSEDTSVPFFEVVKKKCFYRGNNLVIKYYFDEGYDFDVPDVLDLSHKKHKHGQLIIGANRFFFKLNEILQDLLEPLFQEFNFFGQGQSDLRLKYCDQGVNATNFIFSGHAYDGHSITLNYSFKITDIEGKSHHKNALHKVWFGIHEGCYNYQEQWAEQYRNVWLQVDLHHNLQHHTTNFKVKSNLGTQFQLHDQRLTKMLDHAWRAGWVQLPLETFMHYKFLKEALILSNGKAVLFKDIAVSEELIGEHLKQNTYTVFPTPDDKTIPDGSARGQRAKINNNIGYILLDVELSKIS